MVVFNHECLFLPQRGQNTSHPRTPSLPILPPPSVPRPYEVLYDEDLCVEKRLWSTQAPQVPCQSPLLFTTLSFPQQFIFDRAPKFNFMFVRIFSIGISIF